MAFIFRLYRRGIQGIHSPPCNSRQANHLQHVRADQNPQVPSDFYIRKCSHCPSELCLRALRIDERGSFELLIAGIRIGLAQVRLGNDRIGET